MTHHPATAKPARGQSAFEYLLLIGGGVLFVILAVAVVRTALITNQNAANNTAGGYQNYVVGQSDRTIPSAAIKASCAGYWPFQEGTGTTTGDYSGNGNTGTLTGGPTWTTGIVGNGLSMDATNDYVSYTESSNPTGITVSAWVNVNGATGNQQAVVSYGGTLFAIKSTLAQFTFYPNTATASFDSTSFTAFSPGTWHHVAITYDYLYNATNGTGTFYLDGVKRSAHYSTITPGSASEESIGNYQVTQRWFNGTIDEVAVYNRSLTQAEIVGLYANKESGCV